MIQKLFAIYDLKAELYSPLYQANTSGEAERLFSDLLENPKSHIHQHPNDYELVYLGYWDNETGVINADNEKTIMKGKDLVETIAAYAKLVADQAAMPSTGNTSTENAK